MFRDFLFEIPQKQVRSAGRAEFFTLCSGNFFARLALIQFFFLFRVEERWLKTTENGAPEWFFLFRTVEW